MSDAAAQLLRKIRLGEDRFLECREVVFADDRVREPGRDRLADELAAFANSRGGVLVLGVSGETRDVTGIPLDRLNAVQHYVMEVTSDSIEPPVSPIIDKLRLPDACGRMRPVLKIDIPRGFFVHQSPGGYLHRTGTSMRQMKPDFLARMFERRALACTARFDQEVVEDASLDDLDPRLTDRFWADVGGDDRTTALSKLDMIGEDDAGELRPTVAGVLLGTRQPQRWLPQAHIQSVAYRGASIEEALKQPRYQLDAKDHDGPLDEQIAYACRFVARNQRVEASKSIGRRDWPQYDLTAVFEAVVNAVAHRDYSIRGSKVRLRMFSDRIELSSPGALIDSMSVDELPYKRNARNPAIANLLDRCPIPEEIETPHPTMLDRCGKGVPAILARSRRLAGRQPVYELFGSELRLTIFAAGSGTGRSW